jgi:hypothetical protein
LERVNDKAGQSQGFGHIGNRFGISGDACRRCSAKGKGPQRYRPGDVRYGQPIRPVAQCVKRKEAVLRIDLIVPFAEKDAAKALGARFDPGTKCWYVPDGANPAPFEKWMPRPPVVNLRSPDGFHLARVGDICWSCKKPTYVYAIYFPIQPAMIDGHEVIDGEVEEIPAHAHHGPGFMSGATWIGDAAADAIAEHAPLLRLDNSSTAKSRYYMNHCMCCGAKLGDFDLFSEPGSGFFPVEDKHAAAIQLKSVPVMLEAEMSGYHSVELPEPGKARW